jgi:hypothetical protein
MYVAMLDDGLIVEVKEGFTSVFGYAREESIRKTSLELNIFQNPHDREKIIN